MNTISQVQFQEILDQVLQDITAQVAGIRLCPQENLPSSEEMCTLYTNFEGGYQASFALCAEVALLTRLTQYMMQEEHIPGDLNTQHGRCLEPADMRMDTLTGSQVKAVQI